MLPAKRIVLCDVHHQPKYRFYRRIEVGLGVKIVCIEWVDSCSDGDWQSKENALTHSISQCASVGFLVRKTKSDVLIAQSESYDTGNISGLMAIPKKCIKSIEVIK